MYQYAAERSKLFTEEGQIMFLKVRDQTQKLLAAAGACRFIEMTATCGGGDGWTMLACVDRLVELGEISELTGPDVAGQHRVFVRSYS